MNDVSVRLLIFLYTAEKASVYVTIAKVLLQRVQDFPDILIEDIAKMANTTPASITKFSHKLQYASFKELRTDINHKETHNDIQHHLELAAENYQSACTQYVEDMNKRQTSYEAMFDEALIIKIAQILKETAEISVFYAPYSYTCVHVLRNYVEALGIQVQGIKRDLESDFIIERVKNSDVIILISLQGEWIKKHVKLIKDLKEKGKQFIIITAVYNEEFHKITPFIFPFHFIGDTILDTATQISTLFIKFAFAIRSFPKLEKSI